MIQLRQTVEKVEALAFDKLQKPEGITTQDLLDLWDALPKPCLQGPTQGRSYITGASHRHSEAPVHNTFDTPCVTQALTRYIRTRAPGIPFAGATIREGSTKGVHRDPMNSAIPAIVMGLTKHDGGDLWIEHPEGDVAMNHEGAVKRGKVYDIKRMPVVFSSCTLLHGPMPWTGTRRLILVAFTPRNVKTFSTELKSLLLSQGCVMPTKAQLCRYGAQTTWPGTAQLSLPSTIVRQGVQAPPSHSMRTPMTEVVPLLDVSSSDEDTQGVGLRVTGMAKPPPPITCRGY